MPPTRISIVYLASALALLAPATAHAADGALDPSFGSGGKVETTIRGFADTGYAVAMQPDGMLVVAGVSKASGNFAVSDYDVAVTRFRADGTLDPSFGSGGTVITAVAPGDDQAYALALQPDGKIVVAGQASNGSDLDVAVLRYLPDGGLDPSFGGDGIVTTPIGLDDMAYGLALQPDGKIVVTGETTNLSNVKAMALLRYLADGSPDPSFGGGSGWTSFGPAGSYGGAVALQANGRIVVAGAAPDGTDLDFAVARRLADGSADVSFAAGSAAIASLSTADDKAWSLGIQPDGKLVVAGTQADDGNGNFALARYLSDGNLDPSFGGDGMVVSAITISQDDLGAGTLLLQPDGKIVVGGSAVQSNSVFAVARYLPDGALDASFDGDGVFFTAGALSTVWGLAIQPDGRIVAVGAHGGKVLVARHLGDTVAPINPALASSSHTVGTASSDATVDVTLSGASDANTGIDGYSLIWDTSAATLPDETKELEAGAASLTSPSLATGSHYLHLRTVDRAGNWSAAVHLGPFVIAAESNAGGGGGGGGGIAADLVLSGHASPSSAPVGEVVTFFLRVSNDRTYGTATGVRLELELPAELELVQTYADRGSGCSLVEPARLRCELDWLSSSAPYGNVTVTARVTTAGTLAVQASVSYAGVDPTPLDNVLGIVVEPPLQGTQGSTTGPATRPTETAKAAAPAVRVAVVVSPAGRELRLETRVGKATTARVVLLKTGRSVLSRPVRLAPGRGIVRVALPARLAPGVYRLELRLAGGSKVVRTIRVPARPAGRR